jgi:hypothetical protein
MRAASHKALDKIANTVHGVVLPSDDDLPPGRFSFSIRVKVARLVRLELLDPPVTVVARKRAVFSARVPKTTSNLDRDASAREDDVRCAARSGD